MLLTWSLAVEEQFYFTLPFDAQISWKYDGRVSRGLFEQRARCLRTKC